MEDWLTANCIQIVASAITLLALIVTIIDNLKTHAEYRTLNAPSLSFSLQERGSELILSVTNTGQRRASAIQIGVTRIENNGDAPLYPEQIFNKEQTFDLDTSDTVSDRIAISGRNVGRSIFPKLFLSISYKDGKQIVQYERSVIIDYLHSDTPISIKDMDKICSSLKSTNRAAVRIANYLDGCQVGSFDELEILAGKCLYDDLVDARVNDNSKMVKDREKTVQENNTDEAGRKNQ